MKSAFSMIYIFCVLVCLTSCFGSGSGDGTRPPYGPFDFELSSASDSLSVAQTRNSTSTISVIEIQRKDLAHSVSLSLMNCPPNTTCKLRTKSGASVVTATATVILDIVTTSITPTGVFDLVIKGVDVGSREQKCTFFDLFNVVCDPREPSSGATHSITISLQVGSSTARFSFKRSDVQLSPGTSSQFLDIGDINIDGSLDLVTANGSPGTISVLIGDGGGKFDTIADINLKAVIEDSADWVNVADLNGDGFLDVVALVGDVAVLLGDGTGNFGPGTHFSSGIDGFSMSGAIGDFNGDRVPDLAVIRVTAESKIAVLLGDGNGGFSPANIIPIAELPISLATADFDKDGNADLAATTRDATAKSKHISVLFGNGIGGFNSTKTYAPVPSGIYPKLGSLAIADLNGDGSLEPVFVVGRSDGTSSVSALFGDGTDNFGSLTNLVDGFDSRFLTIGDINSDGLPDIIVTSSVTGTGVVSISLANGGGAFGPVMNFATEIGSRSVVSGDINRDGLLDLAIGTTGSSTFTVLIQE